MRTYQHNLNADKPVPHLKDSAHIRFARDVMLIYSKNHTFTYKNQEHPHTLAQRQACFPELDRIDCSLDHGHAISRSKIIANWAQKLAAISCTAIDIPEYLYE